MASWASVGETATGGTGQTPTPPTSHAQSTREAREAANIRRYERALAAHAAGDYGAARTTYEELLEDDLVRDAAVLGEKDPLPLRARPSAFLKFLCHKNVAKLLADPQGAGGGEGDSEALEAAVAHFTSALALEDSDPLLWRALADAASRCNRLPLARLAYERTLGSLPYDASATSELAIVLARLGDTHALDAVLDHAEALNPRSSLRARIAAHPQQQQHHHHHHPPPPTSRKRSRSAAAAAASAAAAATSADADGRVGKSTPVLVEIPSSGEGSFRIWLSTLHSLVVSSTPTPTTTTTTSNNSSDNTLPLPNPRLDITITRLSPPAPPSPSPPPPPSPPPSEPAEPGEPETVVEMEVEIQIPQKQPRKQPRVNPSPSPVVEMATQIPAPGPGKSPLNPLRPSHSVEQGGAPKLKRRASRVSRVNSATGGPGEPVLGGEQEEEEEEQRILFVSDPKPDSDTPGDLVRAALASCGVGTVSSGLSPSLPLPPLGSSSSSTTTSTTSTAVAAVGRAAESEGVESNTELEQFESMQAHVRQCPSLDDVSLKTFVESLGSHPCLYDAVARTVDFVAGTRWDHGWWESDPSLVWGSPMGRRGNRIDGMVPLLFALVGALSRVGTTPSVFALLSLTECALDAYLGHPTGENRERLDEILSQLQGSVGSGNVVRTATQLEARNEARYTWLMALYFDRVANAPTLALSLYARARDLLSSSTPITLANCTQSGFSYLISIETVRTCLVRIALARTVDTLQSALENVNSSREVILVPLQKLVAVVSSQTQGGGDSSVPTTGASTGGMATSGGVPPSVGAEEEAASDPDQVLMDEVQLLAAQFDYLPQDRIVQLYHVIHIASVRVDAPLLALWAACRALSHVAGIQTPTSMELLDNVYMLCTSLNGAEHPNGGLHDEVEGTLSLSLPEIATDLVGVVVSALPNEGCSDNTLRSELPFLVIHALMGYLPRGPNGDPVFARAALQVLQAGRDALHKQRACATEGGRLLHAYLGDLNRVWSGTLDLDGERVGDVEDLMVLVERERREVVVCTFQEDILDAVFGEENGEDDPLPSGSERKRSKVSPCHPPGAESLEDIALIFDVVGEELEDRQAGTGSVKVNDEILFFYDALIRAVDERGSPVDPSGAPAVMSQLPLLAATAQFQTFRNDCKDMDEDPGSGYELPEYVKDLLDADQYAAMALVYADPTSPIQLQARVLRAQALGAASSLQIQHALEMCDKAELNIARGLTARAEEAFQSVLAAAAEEEEWDVESTARIRMDYGRLLFNKYEVLVEPAEVALDVADAVVEQYQRALGEARGKMAARQGWLAHLRIGQVCTLRVKRALDAGLPPDTWVDALATGLASLKDAMSVFPKRTKANRKYRPALSDVFFEAHAVRALVAEALRGPGGVKGMEEGAEGRGRVLALLHAYRYVEAEVTSGVFFPPDTEESGTGVEEDVDVVYENALEAVMAVRSHKAMDKYHHRSVFTYARHALSKGQADVAREAMDRIVVVKGDGFDFDLQLWMDKHTEEVHGKRGHVSAMIWPRYLGVWILAQVSCGKYDATLRAIAGLAGSSLNAQMLLLVIPQVMGAMGEAMERSVGEPEWDTHVARHWLARVGSLAALARQVDSDLFLDPVVVSVVQRAYIMAYGPDTHLQVLHGESVRTRHGQRVEAGLAHSSAIVGSGVKRVRPRTKTKSRR